MKYPIKKIRFDFPILSTKMNDHPLVYLDSAASAQKPFFVINSIKQYYSKKYAPVHRGVYSISNESTQEIEQVRNKIAKFIHAKSYKEIIFIKNTTEGINFLSNTCHKKNIRPGDNIVITEMEHHSNIIPWQILAKEKNLVLKYLPLLPNGSLDFTNLSNFFNERTKIFSITQISNVLGTKNPIKKIIQKVRSLTNAFIIIDGAQSAMHIKIDVQDLDCDFYVFSAHKLYGPSGIGVLYGKEKILDNLSPWMGGGGTIKYVNINQKTLYNDIPWRFEAGSPNTAGIIGLGKAISYIENIGINNIYLYEKKLMQYTLETMKKIPYITIYGSLKKRTGVISFNVLNYNPYDIGNFLNQFGIAIRTGHLCAMPTMSYFKVSSMCRISLGLYNNTHDIDQFISKLIYIKKILPS